MAYQKLQGRRAINVYPQDDVPIPSPSSKRVTGQNDAVVVAYLQDTGTDFTYYGVKAGDVVYNTTTGQSAKVLKVVGANDLLLNANIFLVLSEDYVIYSMELSEDGPVLFVGTGGDLNIVTSGGDTVLLTNLANASYVPIMVKGVQSTGTTCSGIIALW
jgi:hypothetical protein